MNFIYEFTPYAKDKRYGKVLNEHIRTTPDDAWIIVRDRDTQYLTPHAGDIPLRAIADHPDADLFTCITNRIGDKRFLYKGEFNEDANIRKHHRIAYELQQYPSYTEVDGIIPAFFWLFPKRVWLKNPFDEDEMFNKDGTFDIRWTSKITGKKIRIDHLYLFHDYRMYKGRWHMTHLVSD